MTQTQEMTRVEQPDQRIVSSASGAIEVTSSAGGTNFRSMGEVVEFAKLMAVSDVAVPKHLRKNPGACMAVVLQAVEWKMSPYAVANKSYVVNDRISYESQLIHAVIEQRAPLAGRLRCKYFDTGEKRKCLVYAKIKGEDEPFEYMSPETGNISPKNSPLWKTKPDLQLFYNASRDWARMYFPDVILGVYAEDELESVDAPAARAPVPMPRAITHSAPSDAPTTLPPHPQDNDTSADGGGAEDNIGGRDNPNQEEPPEGSQEAGNTDESQTWPGTLPAEAHTSETWINNAITSLKPSALSAHAARKAFHALDVDSWTKLTPERRQEKYTGLCDGSLVLKK